MNTRKALLTIAAGAALLAAAPAFAHPPYYAPAHGWRAKHAYPYSPYRVPAYVVVPARPVYVAPPPVVYAPPPPMLYVPPPRPVFWGTIPVSPSVQFGVRVRL